jgi:tryptophan halogenase
LIVGGGSAGWITANVLDALLNAGGRNFAEITLVESPDIPSVGVGEATVPSIRRTLQLIGLNETEFMRATDATFKSKIRFVDWNRGAAFDHPFDRRQRPETDNAIGTWLASGAEPENFAKAFSILSNTSERGHAPKAVGWPDFASTFPYAYHLDAIKLAGLLTDLGTRRGIRHILDNVSDVSVGADGNIEDISTASGERLDADLYIDCTGFRAVLISGALGVDFTTCSDALLCDRAVTMRVPYDVYQPDAIKPYTLALARNAGWSWDIPLQGRRGVGYVYASQFISDEDAEAELKAAEGGHSDEIETRTIRFASGKRAASWVGNCVAIGLADGFLEPLESSGLYMIEFAAESLGELLPAAVAGRKQAARVFNGRMQTLYDEVAEYLNLHYVTSKRRDTPFWSAATSSDAVLESVRDKFDLWREKRPSDLDFERAQRLFSLESYEYLLFGMSHTRPENLHSGAAVPDLGPTLQKCYAKLPRHETWLAQLG